MKTILVPTSGTSTDANVFATALTLARALRAHLEFYHLRLDPCEAALRDPPAHFCIGPAIAATLSSLEKRDKVLSADAIGHFMDFCERQRVPILETPVAGVEVSAQWLEETNNPEERLLHQARHSDITVLGRRHTVDLMPNDLIERLLKKSGRPIVIAPDTLPRGPLRTVVIGWSETAECARALTAATPILEQAKRVVLLSVTDSHEQITQHLSHLVQELTWHGVVAESHSLFDPSKSVAQQLLEAAGEVGADLLVVGGFGHNSLREEVFGGVTRELVDAAELPVFLMH